MGTDSAPVRHHVSRITHLPRQIPLRQGDQVFGVAGGFSDGGGFEAGVHHAVLAARVLPLLPVGPVDAGPELVPVVVVALADEVARAFPAERGKGDRAPGRALVLTHS